MPLHPATQDWVYRRLGPDALIGEPLGGGVTSHVHAVADGHVLKQVSNERWLVERPGVVGYEARVLGWLGGTSIPVPEVVAVDPDGDEAGFPTLVLTALPGAPAGDAAAPGAWSVELAALSAQIIRLAPPHWVRSFTRYQPPSTARPPAWAESPAMWEEAIGLVSGPAPGVESALIHRDFHPWNALWAGRITGVIDWSQTSVGPPHMDAAHCRANLAIGFDPAVADSYRRHWERATGLVHDRYWDLVTSIDFLPDWRPSRKGNARLEGWVRHLLSEPAGHR